MTRYEGQLESPLRRALKGALIAWAACTLMGVVVQLPAALSGRGFSLVIVVAASAGGLVAGFVVAFVVHEGAGGLVEWATAGTRGRSRPEYSQAETLVIRGAYAGAVRLYAAAADENPADPEPLIRGARVLRDHSAAYASAADWLRRARERKLTTEQDITIARELIELYVGRLDQTAKALPELARLRDRYPDTRTAEWAANRMGQLRAQVWDDVKGGDHGA